MRLLIFSLETSNGNTVLKTALTAYLCDYLSDFKNPYLKIDLPTGTIKLKKWEYINTMKVYEDPNDRKTFFVICNYKKYSWATVQKRLIEYALEKVEQREKELTSRLSTIQELKNRFVFEMNGKKMKVA